MTDAAWAWTTGLILGYFLGLWKRRDAARCAYIRGWTSGVKVTVEDLIAFSGGTLDAECFTMPDGDCVAERCRLHGPKGDA